MESSFESLQASAIDQLRTEGKPNVVGSISEAVTLLRDKSRSAATIVLEGGVAKHDEILIAFKEANVPKPNLRAWSRGNLPGVTVYEIAA